MIPNDQLTRAERIRLEAFAQAGMRYTMRGCPLEQQFKEAEQIEKWLKASTEDNKKVMS